MGQKGYHNSYWSEILAKPLQDGGKKKEIWVLINRPTMKPHKFLLSMKSEDMV